MHLLHTPSKYMYKKPKLVFKFGPTLNYRGEPHPTNTWTGPNFVASLLQYIVHDIYKKTKRGDIRNIIYIKVKKLKYIFNYRISIKIYVQ